MLSWLMGDARARADEGRELFVSDGRVRCPRRGETVIEACFECRWLTDAHLDGRRPSVLCAAGEGPSVLEPVVERTLPVWDALGGQRADLARDE